jgi:hypothetical protein
MGVPQAILLSSTTERIAAVSGRAMPYSTSHERTRYAVLTAVHERTSGWS